jgi:hypothetical protein
MVFFGEQWGGQIRESDEITPEWFDADSLPFEQMWADEPYWLPRLLSGETLIGTIIYDGSCTLVTHAELEPAALADRAPYSADGQWRAGTGSGW